MFCPPDGLVKPSPICVAKQADEGKFSVPQPRSARWTQNMTALRVRHEPLQGEGTLVAMVRRHCLTPP